MEFTKFILISSVLSLAACASPSSRTIDGDHADKSEERRQKVLHEACYEEAREVGGKSGKELRSPKDVLYNERNDTDQTRRLKGVCHKLVQANLKGMTSEDQHALLNRECKMSVDDNTRSSDPRQARSAAKMKRLCDELTVHRP